MTGIAREWHRANGTPVRRRVTVAGMTRLPVLVLLILALALPTSAPATAQVDATAAPVLAAKGKPSRAKWVKDVRKVLRGSGVVIRDRIAAAEEGEKLAINFDIDNTAIASAYDGDGPVERTLKLARMAAKRGVFLVFNTGRLNRGRTRALSQLERAGYDVTMLCMRKKGERLAHSKKRCRSFFARKGLTLIANLGNNPTDFAGDGYEVAYRLPNYGGRLS